MSNAPFTEPVVPKSTTNPEAIAALNPLQSVLDQLNPKAGKKGIDEVKQLKYSKTNSGC